ncbi:low specificity L-threonine aldolase [Agrobacterium sp. SHOUNA12C]|uniref:L-threonine aldolase n=2 Tax=Rhizobium rhizogenes TaxID=359 RepID=B9JA78_RHIR8|nr:low specificity L-threonine aldolase [Rhizobium rhizogenes]ACM27693.1 threonine aldolase protein [Rhizobium rhizogenes K84]KAA6484480.1 low specificity L-threonine aldolase [Agrobacterium sp. ICMP 7243]MCJ9725057.1 low specificity L-threonine aldolase [Agrobacterium sp. BETTINA12B]MCJ9761430.1 low specificity L-threonine aldolase [Agrobacterium sp. SHOUNA12C]OCI92151.1 threonine aldolase [Agrobacterium sp. 13-626]OCJ13753.1 threonine aldolase [Agrobacterium sp. B131/95]
MFFASDNWAGAHSKIAERLLAESGGFASAYGTSDLDQKVEAKFAEIFEREVSVFFVATGTAANSLSLTSVQKPGGISFCHTEAHVAEDECGAPDFFSGARLATVDGPGGKIDPKALATKVARFPQDAIHHGRAAAVTITQATEIGTVYSLAEIDAIAAISKANGLPLHMDGARFANALVALDASPAEMTWKRGVDILSFGGTKNGCWCAEAIVFFNPEQAKEMHFIRKRAAQLFSKSRFIAAQFDGYFQDGLWLDLARHSNRMADRLRAGIEQAPGARLAWPTASNEVFAIISKSAAKTAEDKGAKFYEWPIPESQPDLVNENETLIRLVTSFATTEGDVAGFLGCLA